MCYMHMLFVFIYAYWCPTRVLYQMMFVALNSNTTGVTTEPVTAYLYGTSEFIPIFSGLCVAQSSVFCVVFCRSLFGSLSFLSFDLLRFTASHYPI